MSTKQEKVDVTYNRTSEGTIRITLFTELDGQPFHMLHDFSAWKHDLAAYPERYLAGETMKAMKAFSVALVRERERVGR